MSWMAPPNIATRPAETSPHMSGLPTFDWVSDTEFPICKLKTTAPTTSASPHVIVLKVRDISSSFVIIQSRLSLHILQLVCVLRAVVHDCRHDPDLAGNYVPAHSGFFRLKFVNSGSQVQVAASGVCHGNQ